MANERNGPELLTPFSSIHVRLSTQPHQITYTTATCPAVTTAQDIPAHVFVPADPAGADCFLAADPAASVGHQSHDASGCLHFGSHVGPLVCVPSLGWLLLIYTCLLRSRANTHEHQTTIKPKKTCP